MGTDPFDEFEFKPLTEGLGFHNKKPAPAPAEAPTLRPPAKPTTGVLTARGIDFTEETETENPFRAPLPRRETRSTPTETPAPGKSPVDDILQTLHQNRRMEIELDRKHRQELRHPKTTETWKAAAPRFSPMLLDGMLVTAAGLLCMIIMLVVTRVDLIRNLTTPDTEGMVYASTAALFAGVAFIYMVINRVFIGFTPGEWAYDLRLGKPEDVGTARYAIRAIGRQLLATATGFLVPLIGLVIGKDLLGKISGTSLMRKA